MIAKFGIFEIHKIGIIINVNTGYEYTIHKERLCESRTFQGVVLYDWLIHLTEKSWITTENIGELNTVFIFALDYFKNEYRENNELNMYQTLYVQNQYMQERIKYYKMKNDNATEKEIMDALYNREISILPMQNS